jgi:preprotein translocase subunit SecA
MNQPDELARWKPLVHRVNSLGPTMMDRTDAQLRGLRDVLSGRLAEGQTDELAVAEAFAAVREAARRTTGRSYQDSDLIAGAVLYSGQAAEVEDDGYNNFIAILPIYLCVVFHGAVHYVTTTAELAQSSFREVESLCAMLGLRIGLISGTTASVEGYRRAFDADVTYCSHQQVIFAYLRNHLARDPLEVAECRQDLAIIDQIDSILVDQADLPLLIRAPNPPNADLYRKVAVAASQLKRGRHYEIDAGTGEVSLSGDGLTRGAALLRAGTLEGLQGALRRRDLEDALRARDWYRRGVDYQLADAQIVINSERGSRLDRVPRLQEGIRQAIEAKEGLATSPEEAVWARMTVRDYFRTYARLCGISGVVARSSSELEKIYGLHTAVVSNHRPRTRIDHPELLFEKAQARFEALVGDAAERNKAGQPVMIGVLTAEDGSFVGRLLEARKIEYSALLPGDDEIAASAMAQAGHPGSVTVLTSAVARGYDVILGGDITPPTNSKSEALAGIAVLGAGHSRSWRSDQWLRGLTGRRGEPGETRFFLSLDDALLRGLQSRALAALPARIRERADGAPLGAVIERVIKGIQRTAERADFERRLEQLAVDDVESIQRAQIYSLRDELLYESDLADYVSKLVDEVAGLYVRRYRDPDRLLSALAQLYPTRLTISGLIRPGDGLQVGDPGAEREEQIKADAHVAYNRHEEMVGPATMRDMERRIVLSVLDSNWSQHLSELDAMRAAANLNLSPHDRLPEYRNEATKRYKVMLERTKEDIVGYLFHSHS